jgi:hypothetical protein
VHPKSNPYLLVLKFVKKGKRNGIGASPDTKEWALEVFL